MNGAEPDSSVADRPDPHGVYAERKAAREQAAAELDGRLDRLGLARLGVFAAAVVLAWLAFVSKVIAGWWLAAPLAAFVVLLARYDRLFRAKRRADRAVRFYASGLDRLEDRWPGRGNAGAQYLDEGHLYALDLDVFGKGSLFERICSARTRPGEATLAGWLRRPAAPGDVRRRQEAVAELRPNLGLREDIALLGAEVPPADFADLIGWAESPRLLSSAAVRWLITCLGLLNLAAVLNWLSAGVTDPTAALYFLVSMAVSGGVALPLAGRVQGVLTPVEPMGRELFLLSGLLARIEREPFASPELKSLQATLEVEGRPPSAQIARLAFLVDWVDSMRNQFFLPLAVVLLWRTQMAFAVEAWRGRSGRAVRRWLAAIGEVEALSSLAGYAFENPDDPFPEVTGDETCFRAEALGHPLLPRSRCVTNDVDLGGAARALVVSGSNMSGKSTLLRTVGANAVLALAGGPVRARRLRLSPVAVVATLRVQDSLLEGRSRFFAEITRVRQLLEAAQGPPPVLFLLDELFHGTNSHDRCIGAEALVRRLLDAGAIGLLTTHDLTLTRITERLGPGAANVHFADQFRDGQMYFDYKMRPGVVPHSNALALMRAIGLEV